MKVEAARARSRRKLRFRDFDEVLADARRVHAEGYGRLGNWTPAQAVKHLGNSIVFSLDGEPFRMPMPVRLFGRWILRYVILYWHFPAGARLPRRAERVLVPGSDTDFDDGLNVLRLGTRMASNESATRSRGCRGRS
jgi:hypothetical protein